MYLSCNQESVIFQLRDISKLRRGAAPALALSGLMAVGGCTRTDETAMRAHLGQWFALGQTMSFDAKWRCAAGSFRLVDTQVASALPVVRNAPRAVSVLLDRGAVALEQSGVPPNQSLINMVNANHDLGSKMRRAGIDARDCMDATTESAFSYALGDPGGLLAYDHQLGALILMDRRRGILVVTMGGGA